MQQRENAPTRSTKRVPHDSFDYKHYSDRPCLLPRPFLRLLFLFLPLYLRCLLQKTGSGKTFTMTGLPRQDKPGIAFQTMDRIFESLELKAQTAEANFEADRKEAELVATRRQEELKAKRGLGGMGAAAEGERPPPPRGSGSRLTAFEWRAEVSMIEIYNEEVRRLKTFLAQNTKKES